MRLTEIRTFPVKSLRGASHDTSVVELHGLAHDRRWMVVNEQGRFQSQRELPHMALLAARATSDGLLLEALGQPPLPVCRPDTAAPKIRVTVWDDEMPALDAGAEAAAWLTRTLGIASRLVFQADPASRPVRPAYASPGDAVSFADGFPLLLATAESLADLNARLARPIPMLRFRPNLVVEGFPAWEEDTWRRIRIGAAIFRVAKPCDRCIVTTIDPNTGQRPDPQEPLRTLKTFRRGERGQVYFGQNLVPEQCAEVRLGDLVTILDSGPSNVPPPISPPSRPTP